MIPSMFSLDHRLAELRQLGDELRVARLAKASGRSTENPAGRIGPRIRAILGRGLATGRAARLATH